MEASEFEGRLSAKVEMRGPLVYCPYADTYLSLPDSPNSKAKVWLVDFGVTTPRDKKGPIGREESAEDSQSKPVWPWPGHTIQTRS